MTGDPSPRDDSSPLVPSRLASGQRLRAVVVAAALVGMLCVLVAGCGGGPPPAPSTADSGTPAPAAPPVTPTSPLAVPQPRGAIAVWPHGAKEVRYSSPEAAARGFATDLAGFRDPILGPYQAGDANSGAIEVRPEANGQVTTVFVRQFRDGSWWVVDAATADIRITSPVTNQAVSSPVKITGEARAYGGHATVRIMQDGSSDPLATSVVAGEGDVMTPFTVLVAFPQAASRHGTIVLTTENPSGGQVRSTSVVRVQLT